MSDLETATLTHPGGVAMGTDPHLSRRLASTAGPPERSRVTRSKHGRPAPGGVRRIGDEHAVALDYAVEMRLATTAWAERTDRHVRRADCSGHDQAAPDRVARYVHAVPHPELVEDVRAVPVDGLAADREQRGDLVAGLSLGDELEHLELPRG